MKQMNQREKIRDLSVIAIFTVLAIIGGKLVIPVLVIPFTLQTAVCFLTGLVLGGKRALIAQGLYLFMGLIGLPVFAAGGGPGYLLQPSFGYLPGMMLAAGLIGCLADRADPNRSTLKRPTAFLINLFGLVIIYVCGVGYLYILQNLLLPDSLPLIRALQIGFIPFVVTDGVYALVLAMSAPFLRRSTRRYFIEPH